MVRICHSDVHKNVMAVEKNGFRSTTGAILVAAYGAYSNKLHLNKIGENTMEDHCALRAEHDIQTDYMNDYQFVDEETSLLQKSEEQQSSSTTNSPPGPVGIHIHIDQFYQTNRLETVMALFVICFLLN